METLKEKVKRKGVTVLHVAKMLQLSAYHVGAVIRGSRASPETERRIHTYLDSINTDQPPSKHHGNNT